MLRSVTSFALCATFIAIAAPAEAQISWNRSVSDVHIVHPPGSPPGTWKVVATLGAIVGANAPAPADMSCDVTLLLNGVQIGTTSNPLDYQNGPTCSLPNGGCMVSPCDGWHNGGIALAGNCGYHVYSGTPLCGCNISIAIAFDFGPSSADFKQSDVITVQVTATPGSLPEVDTSDDSQTVPVPDNILGTPFCFGDGSLVTPCPCGNNGSIGYGCANSVQSSGALLVATGWSQLDPDTGTEDVVLHGSAMPATATSVYLKGNNSSANGIVFGDGVRCVSGALIRLGVKVCVNGSSQYPDAGDPSVSVRGMTPPGSGVSAWYQVYYRNPANFCTSATFNISNGVQIDW
jgi:hypothetical protein